MGRPSDLTAAQIRYVQRAKALRAKLTTRAIAARLGASERVVRRAMSNEIKLPRKAGAPC